MIINVSYENLSIEEAAFELRRKMDSLIHEAEMGIMIDKYTYLQENGVILEGDASKESIISRAKRLIVGAVKAVGNFIRNVKRKIVIKLMNAAIKIGGKRVADRLAKKYSKELDKAVDAFQDMCKDTFNEFFDDDVVSEEDFNEFKDQIRNNQDNISKAVRQSADILSSMISGNPNTISIDQLEDKMDDVFESLF